MPYASEMKFLSGLRFAALLGLLPLLSACQKTDQAPSSPPVATPYPTEEEWIISSVCRNAFELLSYAKDKKGERVTAEQVDLRKVPGDVLAYEVTVHGPQTTVEATLHWPNSIWSPAAYLPFCQAAAQALNLGPAPAATAQGNPLHDLLDFSETAIEAENHRISQWLTDDPANADAHEQAALVLGTLAMKENSGFFWDPRDACNHACAHLAVGQFLRGDNVPLSVEGRLAGSLIGLIADTKTQTGRELDALGSANPAPPELAAWLNAGRMRNTRDWRIVKTPETATPLEQVEYVRALGEAVDPDQAMTWLQAHSVADRPDWGRIILEEGFSVDAGHVFAERSIAEEFHAMQTTFPGSFDGGSLVADLNRAPADVLDGDGPGTSTITVIDRGMWARYFQRHLCAAIFETGHFYADIWGVPENAKELDQAVQKSFSTLVLYPYLQLANAQVRHAPTDEAAAEALFLAHPQWAPDFLVWMKTPSPAEARLKGEELRWLEPRLPAGTAYSAFARLGSDGAGMDIEKLYATAPLQFRVAELELARRGGAHYTFAQAQDVMGPLLDYYVRAINEAKNAANLSFDQRVQLAIKSASIDPNDYYDLAQLYLDNHQEDQAAAAYQQWYDHAVDRVEVSNGIGWLVDYYYVHGQQDKAMAIAKEGAEVYSSRGLQTMMELLEKMNRLDDAEEYGQKIRERYQEIGPLAAFYHRQAEAGNADFKAKFDTLAQGVFPDGLRKVTIDSFSGAPTQGMAFVETNDAMRQNGISSDQVVVALDGYGINNRAQYNFVRALSSSPDMDFIVWDGQAYREITVYQPERRFEVEMRDYRR
jgi:hypothetical protein